MESLGFSDSTFTWSDSPQPDTVAAPTEDSTPVDPISEWTPAEFGGRRYDGPNFRWSLLLVFMAAVAAVGAFGYWLYQRPAVEATANEAAVVSTAAELEASLPALERFNATLLDLEATPDTAELFAVDAAARALFDASATLGNDSIETRSSAAAAAGSALDGLRLAGDAHAYTQAVLPILTAPALETDPASIGLDEAALAFGEWQLRFDDVRTALPDGVHHGVTEQIDVLSGDLTGILNDYVEALRSDDRSAVEGVTNDLTRRLEELGELLMTAVGEAQEEVTGRIGAAQAALAQLAG